MTHSASVISTSQFIEMVFSPTYLMGLAGKPVTPWYCGQADADAKLLPPLYKSAIPSDLEREVLREYRQTIQEYSPARGQNDADVMVAAHQAGVPSRIMEWAGNPMAALFLAVESLTPKHGRVWILNPWMLNELSSQLSYVPQTDAEYFGKYIIKLDDPNSPGLPAAIHPMAFRPYRTARAHNSQALFYTVHGSAETPLEALIFFMKPAAFMTALTIDGGRKKVIMKELHNLGITRANLFPGAASLVRTLSYRYSRDYLETPL
jgi:hypothetical protein